MKLTVHEKINIRSWFSHLRFRLSKPYSCFRSYDLIKTAPRRFPVELKTCVFYEKF